MVKILPACKTCVRSGFLCASCQEKLDDGELTEFELDIAKSFLEIEEQNEKFSFLREISFFKAIDYEDLVILVVGKKDKLRIKPELIDWLKETYEIDKLILIEKTSKPRPVIEALIAPYKLISLNEIFLATGDIEFRAILNQSDKDILLFTQEELEDLVLELTGKVTRIEYE
jgi:transcription antitermination factor NusA-like protein